MRSFEIATLKLRLSLAWLVLPTARQALQSYAGRRQCFTARFYSLSAECRHAQRLTVKPLAALFKACSILTNLLPTNPVPTPGANVKRPAAPGPVGPTPPQSGFR
eukprot:2356148-Rhodomonas_salina.2